MEEKVFKILKDICGEDLSGDKSVNLYDTGRLDSLGTIELFVAIEAEFNIILDPAMVERTDIETPEKIVDYLVKNGAN